MRELSCYDLSRIKVKAKPVKRGTLNTTINEDVLNNFKAHCKKLGLPMNMLLESFMNQFTSGEFVLKVGKANKITVDVAEVEDSKE